MDALIDRKKVVEAIEKLPPDALVELSHFIEYLQYKTAGSPGPMEKKSSSGSGFLEAIAGLGASGEGDISERDEEILAVEIDPIYGWNKQGG